MRGSRARLLCSSLLLRVDIATVLEEKLSAFRDDIVKVWRVCV